MKTIQLNLSTPVVREQKAEIISFPPAAEARPVTPLEPKAPCIEAKREPETFLASLIACAEQQNRKEPEPQPAIEPEVEAEPVLASVEMPAAGKPAATFVPPPAPAPNPLSRALSWINRRYTLSNTKQLRVAETVSLGEKRFVAVVHAEGRKFLIGGGASAVSLLTQLSDEPGAPSLAAANFAESLQ